MWTLRRAILVLALLSGAVPMAVEANDMAVLALNETFSRDHLAEGQSVTFLLPVEPGDYLKGKLQTASGRVTLDLTTRDGRHLRRLLDDASGASEFQFVAEGGEVVLRAAALAETTGLDLALTWKVTPEEQTPAAAGFLSPTIERLSKSLEAGGDTNAFWREMSERGTPLIEPRDDGHVLATFLWRGARKNVRLFGSPSGDHENLERLGGSDVWFKSFVVPNDTRLSYQLAPDVPDVPGTARERRVAILSTAQEDPLNRQPWPADGMDRFNRDSVLELPAAPPQPFLEEEGAPKGTLQRFMLASASLGNTREITVYRPAGFDPNDPKNLLLFVFDAADTLTKIPTPTILDNMIARRIIPPTVAVFIANPGAEARGRELPANPVFADFMAEELLPRVLRETGMRPSAERTVLAGASYGGLAAMTVALRHPEAFGNVLSMSGSYWWSPPDTPEDRRNHVAWRLANEPVPQLRFFLSAGRFEIGASRGVASILDTNRHVRDVLLAKDTQVFYREYSGGHDYLIWRGALSDGLVALFGKGSGY